MGEKLRDYEERSEKAIAEQKQKAQEYFNALKFKKEGVQEAEKGKPESEPAKLEFLTLGREGKKYEAGGKIIYKGRKKIEGTIKSFIYNKKGDITGVEVQGDGLKKSRKISKKQFMEWQGFGAAETETVEMAKSAEAETVAAETKKPAEQPEEAPEPNQNEYVSDETLQLLGLSSKKIEGADAPGILRALDKKRQEVETQLSGDIDAETKKELQERKRQICLGIIEVESEKQGKNLKEDLILEEQKQLNRYIKTSGFKNRETYEASYREKYYNDVILKSNLPNKQGVELSKHQQLTTQWGRGPFGKLCGIDLNKTEVAALIDAGINIQEISYKHVFSGRIKVDQQEMSKEQFEAFVLEKYNLLAEKIRQATKEREEELIDKGGIRDYVLAEKANGIIGALPDETPDVAPEFSENPDEDRETRSLKPETPEEQLRNLNNLRNSWSQANKIFKALKENKKIKVQEGEVLDPQKEEDRKELENAKDFLSDEIINIANRISGRNLRKEALNVTGYNPKKKDSEKQKQFRNWLTKEVQEIHDDSIKNLGEIAKLSDKKLTQKLKTIDELYPFSEE